MRECICGHEKDDHIELQVDEDGEPTDDEEGEWEDWCDSCSDLCTFDEMTEAEANG